VRVKIVTQLEHDQLTPHGIMVDASRWRTASPTATAAGAHPATT
jgi:hypothetical protein